MIPNVYGMEDYFDCIRNDKAFCKVDIRLQPINESSTTWKIIQDMSSQNRYHMDRREITRFLCMPLNISKELIMTKQSSSMLLNETFDGLIPHIEASRCLDNNRQTTITFDTSAIVFVLLYMSWIIFATFYERKNNKLDGKKWISAFSLDRNMRSLATVKGDDGLQVLQGARVFAIVRIVLFHVTLFNLASYSDNVEDLDWLFRGYFKRLFIGTTATYVQPFFFISSFLMTDQIYRVYNKNGAFTLQDCAVLLLNRIARFLPTVIVLLWGSRYADLPYGPQTFEILDTVDICRNNWQPLLFFYNNAYEFKDSCYGGSWYISADTQLYLVTMATLYFVLKYRLNFKNVALLLLLSSMVSYAAMTYYYGMSVLTIDPNDLNYKHFFGAFKILVQYLNPVSNWSTTIIGMAAGVYYNHNKIRVKYSGLRTAVWRCAFWGAPLLTHAMVEVGGGLSGLRAAAWDALVRPVNAAGLAVALLGMIQGFGGIETKIYRWKPIAILGNITFSVYFWHFLLVIQRLIFLYHLDHVNYFELAIYTIGILIGSFAVGAIMFLILEQPFLNLQKLILPQLQSAKEKMAKKKES